MYKFVFCIKQHCPDIVLKMLYCKNVLLRQRIYRDGHKYDFTDFLPNAAALKTLNELITFGVSLSKIKNNYNVIGHRQARNTECPGERFYKYVVTLPGWTSNPIPHIRSTTTTMPMDNILKEKNSKLNATL